MIDKLTLKDKITALKLTFNVNEYSKTALEFIYQLCGLNHQTFNADIQHLTSFRSGMREVALQINSYLQMDINEFNDKEQKEYE